LIDLKFNALFVITYTPPKDNYYVAASKGICPNGWHIPTQAEWNLLNIYPVQQLKSTQYWLVPPVAGTDDFGFDARPAGRYNGSIDRYEDLYGFTGW